MNKYIKEYKTIVNKIVKKSFPSLKKEKIIIIESPKIIFWVSGYVANFPAYSSFIFINKRIRQRDKATKIALLAHELCHIESIKKSHKSFLELFIWGIIEDISWIFGKNPSKKDERQTDIETVKKGYGKELLHIAMNRKRRLSPRVLSMVYKRGYLSPEEVKKFMKKYKFNKK